RIAYHAYHVTQKMDTRLIGKVDIVEDENERTLLAQARQRQHDGIEESCPFLGTSQRDSRRQHRGIRIAVERHQRLELRAGTVLQRALDQLRLGARQLAQREDERRER